MPGRKPFHTLNPPLARFDDGRVMTYGTMGGDGQPQIQAQIFTRHARFGMAPGDAIDAPRWLLGQHLGPRYRRTCGRRTFRHGRCHRTGARRP